MKNREIFFDISCVILYYVGCFFKNQKILLENIIMSIHSSLKSSGRIKAKRNVLKRYERIDLMKERGQWNEGDRGLGLPKTKAE
jgi:small basic protein (TIGR04137 family)